MSNFTIQSIFHRTTYIDLCVSMQEPGIVSVAVSGEGKISEIVSRQGMGTVFPTLVLISGNHPVLVFLRDLSRFIDLFDDSCEKFLRSKPDDLQKIGYLYLSVDDLERYAPPSGQLYNFLNANKGVNVILHRDFQVMIGLTNFEIAAQKLRQRMDQYL